MKKVNSRILSLLIALLIILSVCQPVFAAPALPQSNSCQRHVVCTSLSSSAKSYYTGQYSYSNLSKLKGASDTSYSYYACNNNALYNALKTLMTNTQTYSPTYSGTKAGTLAYYWAATDSVSSSSTYIMFYSDIAGNTDGVEMNREHIWPQSRASFYRKGGGADLHHLRPSVSTVNSAKSDHMFGYVRNAFSNGYTTGTVGGKEVYYLKGAEDIFECKDDVKGDVARILLYVYCRWGQPNLYSNATTVPALDADDEKNSGKKVIESLETLLQWCEDDPVDTWEMKQNDLIEQIQGNRNVFIDYPELAWKMFGKSVPSGVTTPSHKGCNHSWTVTETKSPTDISDGYEKVKCKSCSEERVNIKHAYVTDSYEGFPDVKLGSWYYDFVKYCDKNGYMGGYSDRRFGPNDKLKRQDFVLILARVSHASLSKYENYDCGMSDVKKGDYYAAAVGWATENGIVAGYGNGKFGVGDNITREQVATILYRFMKSPPVNNADKTLSVFSDKNKISAYAVIPVAWAVQNGVIGGMADGRAAPGDGATRAQIATIIQRMDEQGMFKKA